MSDRILFAIVLFFPVISSAGGDGSTNRLTNGLTICERKENNQGEIQRVRANQNISNRCRQAIEFADECYRSRDPSKFEMQRIQNLGDIREGGMVGVQNHSLESLQTGYERFHHNSDLCTSIRDNVRKECTADTRTLSSEHDTNYDQYMDYRSRAESEGPRGANYNDYRAQAGAFLGAARLLQVQIQANRDAERVVAQGMQDEAACNRGYETVYAAYDAGADQSRQLMSANGDFSADQPLDAPAVDEHGETIGHAVNENPGIRAATAEKLGEYAHKLGVEAVEHRLGPAGQAAAKAPGGIFPLISAAHKDGIGTVTGSVQTAAEIAGQRGLASSMLGIGTFSSVYFYQSPNFMRCSEVYTNPVAAARAGACPIQTKSGSYSTQSAVRILSSD